MKKRFGKYIKVISKTFPDREISFILKTPNIFFEDCHVQYPADANGMHLTRFFSIEPAAKNATLVNCIVDDVVRWARNEKITSDLVFAPNQPGVRDIARELSLSLRTGLALWDWLPNGRFGNRLVEGALIPGDRVLVYNGVSQQGRCVGQRLPSFVEKRGGTVVGAAVFAKGMTGKIQEVETRLGSRFYSAIQVDIPGYTREECPVCLRDGSVSLRPWTELLL